jgi:GTP-binding protein Era
MLKSGFVGVLGQTNVGKSSFINAILGKKLLIVSPKRQSTRNRIRCIYNDSESQIIFVDTPGLHQPVDRLSRFLLKQAFGALHGLDLVLYMVEPWIEIPPYDQLIFKELRALSMGKFLLINKIDRAKGNQVPETIKRYAETSLFEEIIPISCFKGTNLETTLQLVKRALPEGPRYFPEDRLTDRSERFVIAEFIREAVYQFTQQEIPYSVYVEVREIAERSADPLLIHAVIIVSRESQKGILIGQGGRMIKAIGQHARPQVEALFGRHVYLDLQIRVQARWNEHERQIIAAIAE